MTRPTNSIGEEALRRQAEQNVLAVRGSYDAPGFDACVEAEVRRLSGEVGVDGKTTMGSGGRDVGKGV